jgi:hypothetical protein
MVLIVFPETSGEQHQDAHNLQTANQHQEGTNPLDEVGQLAP